jgi:hypothetical protein
MLIKDRYIQLIFKMYIKNILATSELNILKPLAATETLFELNDYSNFENEERELTIVQREPIPESGPILTTKTEIRAHLLVEHLKHNVQERSGGKFLSSEEIVHFLKYEIDELY